MLCMDEQQTLVVQVPVNETQQEWRSFGEGGREKECGWRYSSKCAKAISTVFPCIAFATLWLATGRGWHVQTRVPEVLRQNLGLAHEAPIYAESPASPPAKINRLLQNVGQGPLDLMPFHNFTTSSVAASILEQEPKARKWHDPAILKSFESGINFRGPRVDPVDLASGNDDIIDAMFNDSRGAAVSADGKWMFEHGTSLSILISCLRNTNGQLVGSDRRAELGIGARTGELVRAKEKELHVDDHPGLACGGNLLRYDWNNLNMVLDEYMPGVGWANKTYSWDRFAFMDAAPNKWTGMPGREIQREYHETLAGNIPVLLIGDAVDDGSGNALWLARTGRWPPSDCNCSGAGTGASGEYWGKRLNIRAVLVGDAQQPENDDWIVRLVIQVIRGIAAEEQQVMTASRLGTFRGALYDDIRVGSYYLLHPEFRKELGAPTVGPYTQEYELAAAKAVQKLFDRMQKIVV